LEREIRLSGNELGEAFAIDHEPAFAAG